MRLHTIPHPALPLTWWVQSGTTTVGRIKRWDTDAQIWSFQNPDGVPFGVHVASHLDDPEGALAAFERRSEWRAYLPTPDAAPVAEPVATVPIPAGTELGVSEPPTPAQALADLTRHFMAMRDGVHGVQERREAEAMRCKGMALALQALADWWRSGDVAEARRFLSAHAAWDYQQIQPGNPARPIGAGYSLDDRDLTRVLADEADEAERESGEVDHE